MDTVTYPSREVQDFVGTRFVAAKFGLADRTAEVREVVRRFRTLWAPGFVVLDQRGEEIRRFIGYQPPRDFIAELQVALGKIDLLHRRPAQAFTEFRGVADLDPPAPVSAEAMYWAGIAAYQRDGTPLESLKDHWDELRTRFPESRWWTHADIFR